VDIDYSIIIRTLGNAGDKYKKLLKSIDELCPKPKNVYVVLPEGYRIPDERLGYEHFYFCKKGMVSQRLYGINICTTKYALVCDDDVSFSSEFVAKLYTPIKMGLCAISVGPLLDFFVPKGIKSFVSAITASSVQTVFNRNYYVKMLKSGGWSYNRNIDTSQHKYYPTESAAWTCFFADVDAVKRINLEDEVWLERNQYAALDDQVMFFKACCRGIKTIVVSDALYEHLDAGTAIKSLNTAHEYAGQFNKIVFWHRFIFSTQRFVSQKIVSIICFAYSLFMTEVFCLLKLILGKTSIQNFVQQMRGIFDSFKYIFSNEYKTLQPVKR